MISHFCDTDDWSPTVNNILNDLPFLNEMDLHISINCISVDESKKYNLLILQESPAVLNVRNIIDFVKTEECSKKFFKTFTSVKELLVYPWVEYIHPSNRTWIEQFDFLPLKTKNVSMVTSNNYFLNGHKKRIAIAQSISSFVDLYGRGFNPIENKVQGLKDYYFSVAIENDYTDNYFSEKLIDCFLTCTIPIYLGCSYAYEVFNPKGMININELQSLEDIRQFDKHYYNKNLDAVVENYYLAQKENRYLNETLKYILYKLYNEHYNQ
jgi:hypothetical protein